jgi:hypothetical protein
METSELGITDTSRTWCKTLMNSVQKVPELSLSLSFGTIYSRRHVGKYKTRVIQDITRLIVPSTETLATYGARHLDHLIENVNDRWTGSIPVEGPRPQPDYSVGFRRSAFTYEQLNKLDPLIGSVYDTSFFVATYQVYFPFLTCEVKCGASALDTADRQNAHSMNVAVRGRCRALPACRAGKGAPPGDPRLLNLARPCDGDNLRPLSYNRWKQDHFLPLPYP